MIYIEETLINLYCGADIATAIMLIRSDAEYPSKQRCEEYLSECSTASRTAEIRSCHCVIDIITLYSFSPEESRMILRLFSG
jgi:hypothetical protein